MIITKYLPEKIYTNEDLEKDFPDWTSSKVESKVGIRERHIVSGNETALDLAYEVSKLALQKCEKDNIDFILLCTQSPDYFLPTGACILQEKLGLRKNIGALDFNMGCSGYIYGLGVAKGLLATKIAENILLITTETYSKHIHAKDRANRSIFGDGATATVLDKYDLPKILEFEFGTDGSGKDNLIIHNGAMRCPYNQSPEVGTDENGNFYSPNHLYMNGPEIFNFTIENIPLLVESVLKKNKMTFEMIDYFIFHQANKYMLEYLRKKIKIPVEKFYNNILLTGNTVSSTIPIALQDSIENGLINQGNKILMAGFGVGYSWGAIIIEI